MTDLLSELRRSPDPGDRGVAELLHSARPSAGSRPRASEALAAFISERGSGVTPSPELREPAESSGLLVVLGNAPEPRSASRRRVPAGVWAQAAVAAAIAVVAVAVATGGPSRDVVRPTDSSRTVVPATTVPADHTVPTPRRHGPVAPSAGSTKHAAGTGLVAGSSSGPDHPTSARTSTPAADGEGSGRETDSQAPGPGDDRGDEAEGGTHDGGKTQEGHDG